MAIFLRGFRPEAISQRHCVLGQRPYYKGKFSASGRITKVSFRPAAIYIKVFWSVTILSTLYRPEASLGHAKSKGYTHTAAQC